MPTTLQTVARIDADSKQIVLEVRVESTGNLAAGYHRVVIALDDLVTLFEADELTPIDDDILIKFRKLKWKDYEADCIEKFAYVLMSQTFSVPPP